MNAIPFPQRAEASPLIPARHAVIAWTPAWFNEATRRPLRTEGLVEVRHFRRSGRRGALCWTRRYACSGGAANWSWRRLGPQSARDELFRLFREIVCTDKADPAAAVAAFSQIAEFVDDLPRGFDPEAPRPDPWAQIEAPAQPAIWFRHGDPVPGLVSRPRGDVR